MRGVSCTRDSRGPQCLFFFSSRGAFFQYASLGLSNEHAASSLRQKSGSSYILDSQLSSVNTVLNCLRNVTEESRRDFPNHTILRMCHLVSTSSAQFCGHGWTTSLGQTPSSFYIACFWSKVGLRNKIPTSSRLLIRGFTMERGSINLNHRSETKCWSEGTDCLAPLSQLGDFECLPANRRRALLSRHNDPHQAELASPWRSVTRDQSGTGDVRNEGNGAWNQGSHCRTSSGQAGWRHRDQEKPQAVEPVSTRVRQHLSSNDYNSAQTYVLFGWGHSLHDSVKFSCPARRQHVKPSHAGTKVGETGVVYMHESRKNVPVTDSLNKPPCTSVVSFLAIWRLSWHWTCVRTSRPTLFCGTGSRRAGERGTMTRGESAGGVVALTGPEASGPFLF